MTPRNPKELSGWSGAYALGALTEPEKTEFEALLAESEETRTEVTELTDTANELGLAIAPEQPSAGLRNRLLAQVAVTPQLAPLETVAPVESPTTPTASTRAETKAQARWFSRPATALVAVAAAVALLFGGGVLANTLIQGQQTSSTAALIDQITAATDYQRKTTDVVGGGTATVVWSVSLQRSALIVNGIPVLPSGKTYELWYIDAKGATAAGTFDVSDGGMRSVVLAGAMTFGDTIGVTVEPAGGSSTPTSDPVAVVQTV